MIKDLANGNEKPANEPIVIADECGDSIWEAVLGQEDKACHLKAVSINSALPYKFHTVQLMETTKFNSCSADN